MPKAVDCEQPAAAFSEAALLPEQRQKTGEPAFSMHGSRALGPQQAATPQSGSRLLAVQSRWPALSATAFGVVFRLGLELRLRLRLRLRLGNESREDRDDGGYSLTLAPTGGM